MITSALSHPSPDGALRTPAPTGVLVLADSPPVWGHGIGAVGISDGELCFNTAMTGYQEILSDLSYAGQIVVFTFPHIGNVGTNDDDMECDNPAVRGCIIKARPTPPSNYRSSGPFEVWLRRRGIVGLYGLDTRALTQRLRRTGFADAVIAHAPDGVFDMTALAARADTLVGLQGAELALDVTGNRPRPWSQGPWQDNGSADNPPTRFHVVALDYGIKHNILRSLAALGCRVTVMPAASDADAILAQRPQGLLLSNGPGDPSATGSYALEPIRTVIRAGLPVLGICLGHQLLALALGAATRKMHQGHHGANHPVKDLSTGEVAITSMNHGFQVDRDSLPDGVVETHVSLFDGSNCGIALTGRPVFSVQYHPEASPGPHDSLPVFGRFVEAMEQYTRQRAG
ncbi:MAG: glutamine-hydrolyzing carbamoyl-phosphate synthase small subunit [Alphaproteobacteria bacterium]